MLGRALWCSVGDEVGKAEVGVVDGLGVGTALGLAVGASVGCELIVGCCVKPQSKLHAQGHEKTSPINVLKSATTDTYSLILIRPPVPCQSLKQFLVGGRRPR